MAGRHRRPSAWRRLLTSLVRSRDKARSAALEAEVVALRATVLELRAELDRARVDAAVSAAAAATALEAAQAAQTTAAGPRPGWVTIEMPLVTLALRDPAEVAAGPDVAAALAAPDRSPDAVDTEIVLEPTPAPDDRLAWRVLANLPERPLLDPRLDRDQEPADPAVGTSTPAEQRRTA